MSLREQDITKKEQVNNALPESEKELEFEAGGNNKYEVEAIIDSIVYGQQANDSNQIPNNYYLISWKGYLEEENTWKPSSVVIHLWKLINTFYKEYPEKPTVTSLPLNFASLMARPTVPKKQPIKQKRNHLNKRANKRGKK